MYVSFFVAALTSSISLIAEIPGIWVSWTRTRWTALRRRRATKYTGDCPGALKQGSPPFFGATSRGISYPRLMLDHVAATARTFNSSCLLEIKLQSLKKFFVNIYIYIYTSMYVFNMYIEIKLHSLKNFFVNIYTSMYVFNIYTIIY